MKKMLIATAAMLLVANVTLVQTAQARGETGAAGRPEPALPTLTPPLAG